MLGEMEADYNRGHFDRKAPLDRLQQAGRPELSRLFYLLIRCWPGLRQGWCGHILSRFFLWSVFLTQSLSVCERGEFYQLLGMDPARFDAEVMRHTNRTARCAFPWVFRLDGRYLELRDRLVETFRSLRQAHGLARFGLRLRFAALLLRQFAQPMERSDVGEVA